MFFEIKRLSDSFYDDYPEYEYPEILRKKARPYTCLLLDFGENFLICIPFRSDIKHNDAFLFTGTSRSNVSRSGLDYQKIVLISDSAHLDDNPGIVDNDEYIQVLRNISKIAKDASKYISRYRHHIDGSNPLSPQQYQRHYRFSTLPYFDDLLR